MWSVPEYTEIELTTTCHYLEKVKWVKGHAGLVWVNSSMTFLWSTRGGLIEGLSFVTGRKRLVSDPAVGSFCCADAHLLYHLRLPAVPSLHEMILPTHPRFFFCPLKGSFCNYFLSMLKLYMVPWSFASRKL